MNMKAIPYGRQHITEADIEAVTATLQSDFLTTGPKVKEFEEKFAAYIGVKYAVAVANGTAALHLCAMALDVNEETKVITSPITFAASANCVRYCGGQVDFCDIDPETILLDIAVVRQKLEAAPKGTYQGLIPVNFAGYPVDMEAFRQLADEYGLWIIEDACHAPGGSFVDSKGQEQFCGNGQYADLAIFSFHPVKHIACGEGGMITTNDKALYDRLMILRTHGITKREDLLEENHGGWYYEMVELGYNYRMPDILCALGISQLKKAAAGLARRRAIAKRYNEAFKDTDIEIIIPPDTVQHAYHLYVVQVKNRKGLYEHLRSQAIYAQIHYIPVHTLPYYKKLGFQKGDFPLAEAYYEKAISLPMYPSLTDEEQTFVIKSLLEFFLPDN
ncbi:MAG: UDP-4-amino-4,6-dideoxy-N-acetyl-beta-L-altrosamine transaminase [Bacteroidota bacterium]